jgi:hypothetical protein
MPSTTCRWLGVAHIYLTENSPVESATLLPGLQSYVDEGFVSYRIEPRPHAQIQIYEKCLLEYRHHHNWLAFFDADEFLILRNRHVPRSCPHFNEAAVFNWFYFSIPNFL